MRYENLTGKRFGQLIAVSHEGRTEGGRAIWRFACDCGGQKIAEAANVKSGRTRSCGCAAQEQRKAAAQSQRHALSASEVPRERKAWEGMLRRCYSPKHPSFARYGGRGIAVCERWRESFAAFFADLGPAPEGATLERIDNAKDYAPDNCKWASRKEQANNRRSNRLLTHDGVTLNITQWADRLGWAKGTLASRLKYGWPVERVLTEKPRHR